MTRKAQEETSNNENPDAGSERSPGKLPFDIDRAMDGVRDGIKHERKAALFELYDDGFTSPFEQLLACIISIRTRDEDTVPLSRRLFAKARTAAQVAELSVEEIDRLISGSTFHEAKAPQILEIARRTVAEFGGELAVRPRIPPEFSRRRHQVREPGARHRLRPASRGSGHPRSPDHEPLGLRRHQDAREDHGRPGNNPSEKILGGNQRAAGAIRQTHLHRHGSALLDLSRVVDVPPSGGDQPSLAG